MISLPQLDAVRAADAARTRIVAGLAQVGCADVRADRAERMIYATDASPFQIDPLCAVVVRDVDEAIRVVQWCAGEGIAILPRGGGTSLNGQSVNAAVVLDMGAHCRRVLSIDQERGRAWVEPGVVLDKFNADLAPLGLMFAPDPATSSHNAIGGCIGNNSAGAHSIIYGRTVENLYALDVVLADGTVHRLQEGACDRDPVQRRIAEAMRAVLWPIRDEIRARFPRILRHVDGYNFDLFLDGLEQSTPGTMDRVNLAHLVCGSEGTLCTILGAEVKLVPTPKAKGLAIMGFESVDASLAALDAMLATGPAAVEMVDEVIIDIARGNREYAKYVELMPRPEGVALGAVMYVEYFGQTLAEVEAKLSALRERLPSQPMEQYTDAKRMAEAWRLRKAGEPLLHGVKGLRRPLGFVEDTAVDPAKLPGFIKEFKAILAGHGTHASFYAHASVGCLHIRPMLALTDAGDRERVLKIGEEVTDLVVRYGGALSGEHGSGRSRTALQLRYFGETVCNALAAVKAIWDPAGIMNPGIKIDVTRRAMPIEDLRLAPNGVPVHPEAKSTFFTYEKEDGFGHAIEMCNGAGLCRRLQGTVTMCPSYQATLDERHSTRGRGNHLRLAITGQLGANGTLGTGGAPGANGASHSHADWNQPDVQDTLSLCLSCKACKSECPSNVDISKLKAEYTAQGYAAAGRVPFRARAFGRVRGINRLLSRLWPLANLANRIPFVRTVQNWVLGIDTRRSMPLYAEGLDRWYARRGSKAAPGAPAVVLFPDCFTMYNEPRIGHAAIELLEAFGYRVVLPTLGCCGRSLISTGMLAEASRTCRATAEGLMQVMEREHAVAVVGCEPSCMSAIRDDWLELKTGLDVKQLRALAAQSFMVEEFLEKQWDAHPTRPAKPAFNPGKLALHAHCHQKALWGAESSAAILRRYFGADLEVLQTGCCGLAGSFGFTEERYDLSMKIAEQAVLPAVRARPGTMVCAPGTSCRHQIHDGAGREALHPVEVLRRVLG
ncbi:MAG: FAD-binding protein [Planctomycetota bacterium]|nr:FAD-binding protein [Planctomycetota bacterium]